MYHYDTLGDEKFQEFCQALICATYPDAQCLPVGQPDGGRDAFYYGTSIGRKNKRQNDKDLIVFQVKYIKNPKDNREERGFLEDVIKKENVKIERLKRAGLKKYILITNLQGTSHYKVGSIDKVNQIMTSLLGVESYCWWRDDLDRRLECNPQIKWSYPEILKATDLLEKLVHGRLGEDEERRKSAIRAYMTCQYEDDQELKFKQTDLRSTMTDLFVDLPMCASHHQFSPDEIHYRRYWRRNRFREVAYGEPFFDLNPDSVPSAEYLIARNTLTPERIVLEGAPGQGKSTVTQYVCQVLRMHLLNKVDELQNVPLPFQVLSARIPFRVDLRDLAKWISGVDPFQPKHVVLNAEEPRSLEGFLAGQIRSKSGGHTFNVSDLTAVARVSHMFLALDGFDEVAEINIRQQLVDEITKGVNRLINAGDTSIITVVTSRPAAFAKSVVFPRENWSYFELLPLERSQIDDYTTKWMKAKGLKSSEENQLRTILENKLKESHAQYLTKNPMQLTILLSLVHSRGPSLPEKRTSMYDAYMDMFFSRESEKSNIVRENRELLIDIHRYLAWKLQTAAEAGDSGSIERSALRSKLFEYLDREGEDTTIVDELFNGIIERVGALVSRVQDTYEFEVQPLREYFAARHLYETSPYPSDDQECPGDKFDRFKALSVNPYWLNVARFYGGCFNKGELLTLANELMELEKQPAYSFTSHPRSMAMMLLSDWVFSAYQPAVKKVISFACEHPKLRLLLANAEETGSSLWSSLPERSGRNEFLDILWNRVLESRFADEQIAAAHAISQNSSIVEKFDRWKIKRDKLSHRDWVRVGSYLNIFNHPEKLQSLPDDLSDDMINYLIINRQFKFLEKSEYIDRAKSNILNYARYGHMVLESGVDGRLSRIATVFSLFQYALAFSDENVPLRHSIERRLRLGRTGVGVDLEGTVAAGLTANELRVFQKYEEFLDLDVSVLATSLAPWRDLVEAMRLAWGDCPAIDQIAFIGAGIRSTDDSGVDEPLTSTSDLVGVARFARLKSGAPRWWEARLEAESDPDAKIRLLQVLSLWATPKTLLKLAPTIEEALISLSQRHWNSLVRNIHMVDILPRGDMRGNRNIDISILRNLSCRTNLFIGRRLVPEHKYKIAMNMMDKYEDIREAEGRFVVNTLVYKALTDSKWRDVIPYIKKIYLSGAMFPMSINRKTIIDRRVALEICKEPDNFPLRLLAAADNCLQSAAGAAAPKLQEVAKRERWFVK